ncbi:helix-turn-helix domain-containing protein [Microseira wollei]|uniref:Integrase catalytic subunit n=1 Tax=Microseira wollei NIES-4236 TaxID=2530354 RepID=A0AAV3XQP7_9CYAN|nr:helix-turn-helix domain-containing protein [Microseira wollei]GET43921.1 integrase catalytic subunit [Microseira wollei NIES-4236]
MPASSSREENNSAQVGEIFTEFSDEAFLLQQIIQSLLLPCDRITYGQRQREAAERLGVSVRTVRRLVKKWEEKG